MVTYAVLGDLTILGRDRTPIPIPAGHARNVLALLLLQANRLVSTDDLISVGWGDTPPQTRQIYKTVNHIRAIVQRAAVPGTIDNNRSLGYALRIDNNEFDLALFQRGIEEAERDPAHAIAALRRALSLWRGPRALANLPENAFADAVAALAQRRRRAATRLLELEINARGYPAIVAEAVEYAGQYAADARLCELAMLASYRCGHAGDSVKVYERHVQARDEEFADRPQPQTRELHHAVLRGDEGVLAGRERALGLRASGPGRTVPLELPAAPSRLVARDELLAEAVWLLSRAPDGAPAVLVIAGRSGTGKTAMARSVAHRVRANYPDGVLYLELRDVTGTPVEASECLAHCLRALDVVPPEERADRAAALRTQLAHRRMLIVLDDALDENQVRDLIPGSAGSAVIITTHHELPGLDGAHTLRRLRELDPAQSLDLYQHLVRSAGRDPDEDDPAQTQRLLALCDGLPLAIAVVAAQRVREWARPVAELADRLERQGPLALEYDNRSVARSIGASVERLDDQARALFRALGRLQLSHVGAWTAWAVLDAPGADPYGALSQLLASNVLTADGPGRYGLHSLTHRYATWCADQEPAEPDGVAVRAYRALLTLVRRAHRGLYGGDFEVVHSAVPDWQPPATLLAEVDRDPRGWFDLVRPEIRAAVRHCARLGLVDLCWDLAVSAHEYYTVAGQHDDWYETHTTALAACRAAGDERGEAVLLTSLGQPALVASRRAGAVSVADLRRAARLLQEHGDDHGRAIALRTLANALRRDGRLTEPLQLFTEALNLYARSDDVIGRWQTQRFIGQTYLDLGEYGRAIDVLRDALTEAERIGSPRVAAQTQYWLGQAYLAHAGSPPDGTGHAPAPVSATGAAEGLDLAEGAFRAVLAAVGGAAGLGRAYALHGLGEVALRRGDVAGAAATLAEAAQLATAGADATIEGRVHLAMAAVWRAQGRRDEEIATLERAVSCFAAADNRSLELAALAAASRAHPPGSDAARVAWERLEARYRELGLPAADQVHRPLPLPSG